MSLFGRLFRQVAGSIVFFCEKWATFQHHSCSLPKLETAPRDRIVFHQCGTRPWWSYCWEIGILLDRSDPDAYYQKSTMYSFCHIFRHSFGLPIFFSKTIQRAHVIAPSPRIESSIPRHTFVSPACDKLFFAIDDAMDNTTSKYRVGKMKT